MIDMVSRSRPDADRRLSAAFWMGVTLFLALGIGWRYPWPADEPRFVLVALEMLQSGDWLFPHRAGELYPDKPPMFMWLLALSYLATGSMIVAFLLPSLLASLLTAGLVWDLARRIAGRNAAHLSVILLLSTAQFSIQARSAQIDATLCAFVTLGLYGLLRHLVWGPNRRWLAVAWLVMGTGVITKGVGFLPLFVLPGFWVWRHRFAGQRVSAPGRVLTPATLLFLMPIALWLIPMAVSAQGDGALEAYRDNILFRQTAVRYAQGLGHHKPVYYYLLAVFPLLWLPLNIVALTTFRRWRNALGKGDGPTWLLLSFCVLTLVFFSLSPGKRGVYVLPIVPALTVLCSPYLARLLQNRSVQSIAHVAAAAVAVGVLVLAFQIANGADWAAPKLVTLGFVTSDVARLLIAIGLASLVAIGLTQGHGGVRSFLAVMVVSTAIVTTAGYRLQDPVRSGAQMMTTIDGLLPAGAQLAAIDFREQMLLHARQDIVHWGFHAHTTDVVRSAAHWLTTDPRRWLLAPAHLIASCFDASQSQPVGRWHRRDWRLLRASAVLESCRSMPGKPPPFTATAVAPRW